MLNNSGYFPASWTQYTGSFTTPSTISAAPVLSFAIADALSFTNVDDVVVVPQSAQTISFPAPQPNPATYGVAPISLGAIASSGLTVSYSVAGPCTVSGSTLAVTGVGTCTITASQNGNSMYLAATSAMQSLTVNPAPLTITANNQSKVYGAPVPTLTASYNGFVNGDGPASLTTAPTLTTTATADSPVSGSPYAITASGAVDPNYNISYVDGSLTVTTASQTITFPALPDTTYGQPAPALQASAPGGPVTYTTTGPCTASGSTLTVTGAGTCAVTAHQAGNDNYGAASDVERDFTIAKNNTSLALRVSPSAGSTAGQSVTLTATLSLAITPGGTVQFVSNRVPISGCNAQPLTAADGGTFTATCTTTELATGDDTLGATYSGDGSNNLAPAATVTYTVAAPPSGGGSQSTPSCATDGNPFTDVTTANQFCDDIDWAKTNKIATGNTDGSFTPKASVLRDAMAGFLYRYEHPGATAPACATAPFSDVATSNVFCADIAALKAEGVIAGNGDGTFSPATPVSRQTMAAFLYRIANPGKTPAACTTAPFKDVAVSNVFCGDINYLLTQKVTDGYPDGGFHPATVVARQEMAAFLHRLYTATH